MDTIFKYDIKKAIESALADFYGNKGHDVVFHKSSDGSVLMSVRLNNGTIKTFEISINDLE